MMTNQKIAIAARSCAKALEESGAEPKEMTDIEKCRPDVFDDEPLVSRNHLLFMCEQIETWARELEENNLPTPSLREKAMRWLGFVQGSLWSLGYRSVDELKDMNRSTEEENMKKPLRIYVAACVEEYTRARNVMRELRARGAVITHDWTIEVEHYGGDDQKPTPRQRRDFAKLDQEGVRSADIVLVLTPEDRRRGCGLWIETGMAIAYERRLILTGPQRDRSVFCELGERVFDDLGAIEACFFPKNYPVQENA